MGDFDVDVRFGLFLTTTFQNVFDRMAFFYPFLATALYLLIQRKKQTLLQQQIEQIERDAALKKIAKLAAVRRGRKIKKQTDKQLAQNKANQDPAYMAPFNPSVEDVVNNALDLLQLDASHVLWDLGCGDGRLLVEACKRHQCTAVGVEYDKKLCIASKKRAEEAGVAQSIDIIHDDIMNVNFSSAQRMYMFLLPDGLKKLTPKIKQVLKNKNARIVTYAFSITELKPIEIRDHKGTKVYLYTQDSVE